MSLITSLLSSLTGGAIGAPPVDSPPTPPTVGTDGKPIDPNAPTQMDELVGTVQPKPAPTARVNYYDPNTNNSEAVEDANKVVQQYPQHQHNAGLYGILPQNVQHGTLRNILGALGDAFLVQSGNKPTYQPRMDREAVGDAAIGQDQDYGAAANRVFATGAPGSSEMGDTIIKNGENARLRQQIQEQNNQYHQDTTQYHKESVVQRLAPTVSGWAQGINDPGKYGQVYAKADAMAKRIDPSYDASVFGYVSPDQWKPGAMDGVGATTGQIIRNNTSNASIQERANASGQAHQDRQQAMGLRGPTQPTASGLASRIIEKHRNGIQTTPDEDAFLDTYIQGKKSHSRGLLTTGGAAPAGGGQQPQYQQGAIYKDANGNRAKYDRGRWIPQ